MEKLKKVFKVLGILIALGVVFFVADYIRYRKTKEKQTQTLENTLNYNTQFKKELKQVEDEIYKETMTEFLNQKENNGFILSNYKEACEIDLYYIFATSKYYVAEEKEIKQYENLTNSTVTTALFKISVDEAIDVLLNKTGVQFSENEIENMMTNPSVYLPLENSYYVLNSDDLFTKVKCTKVENLVDKLVLSYESEEKTGNKIKGIVTLKRNNNQNGWVFVSNYITETNLY